MTTKEKIIITSLELFAQKGYDGVSVREIAAKVGVQASALYKHFSNKDEILNGVVSATSEKIKESYQVNQIPEAVKNKDEITQSYEAFSTRQLCDLTWNIFQLFTKDSMVSNFRKLLMREQFENKHIAKLYDDFFVEGAVNNFAKIFEQFSADGFFKPVDSKMIALHFYAPIQLMFQKYDCQPESEPQLKEILFQHIELFGKNFSAKN